MKGLMAALACAAAVAGGEAKTMKLPVYGECEAVDLVDCTADGHRFAEHPAGASEVRDVLGRKCRVLPVQDGGSSYMKWRLGEGKGLKPNGAYVVVVEYPDDGPRDYIVRNNGNNSRRSFYTGAAIGDAWEANIVGHHPESLRIPQTGRYQLWTALTFLGRQAHTVREDGRLDIATDGFDLILAQFGRKHHPETMGLAASRIILCEILDEKKAYAKIRFPEGLPRRRIFWREEMADGEMGDDGLCPMNGGLDWIEQKFRTMKILAQNTYMKDLLEFGHNQHWNPNWRHGQPGAKSAQWMWGTNGGNADVWSRAVPLAVDAYGLDVLPYYEYAGAAGDPKFALGPQKRAEPLDLDNKPKDHGVNYTHIWWSDGKLRVDITDPDTFEEFKYILDGTVLRFREQVAKGGFAGVFMRPRPGEWPVSFSDAARARFAREANGGAAVSRRDLKSDRALYDRYLDWFGRRRADFMDRIRGYLEENGVKDAIAILENDVSEPGYGPADRPGMITDDVETWKRIIPGKQVVDINEPAIVADHLYLKALRQPAYTWGPWEWQHACPMTDPQRYAGLRNVWIAMSYNNLLSVMDPFCFSAFSNANGTQTIVRHFGLNEHMVEDRLIGYSICDFERAGRACMIAEVEAMAKGDPVNLGYLMGSVYTRGFPAPVREFNLNFLALPALPSKVVPGASSDSEVTVREIDCTKRGKGRYYAVVHTGRTPKANVRIRFPKGGKAFTSPVSGKAFPSRNGSDLVLDLKPWQLLSLHR